MKTKTAPEGAAIETQCKYKAKSLYYKTLLIFSYGQPVTARELNLAVGFNDSRKAISVLRAKGYPIKDERLPDRRKLYHLDYGWERIMREQDVKHLAIDE